MQQMDIRNPQCDFLPLAEKRTIFKLSVVNQASRRSKKLPVPDGFNYHILIMHYLYVKNVSKHNLCVKRTFQFFPHELQPVLS
jgi:hypothetical protein